MIVRLHNLSVRNPLSADLQAVTGLMAVCDSADSGIADPMEDDVRQRWQTKGFNLQTDAWVIVTGQGQIVGYADVQRENEGELFQFVCVHPDYRGRGIGKLLIHLMEERARQLVQDFPLAQRVTLSIVLSSLNERAKGVFEREGYLSARRFWRLVVEMDGDTTPTLEEFYRGGKLKLDLVIDTDNLLGAVQTQRRSGMYTARQYEVYQKVLRPGMAHVQVIEELCEACCTPA